MPAFSVTHKLSTREGWRTVAATLKPSCVPGTWSVWANDPADAPNAWHEPTRALVSRIDSHEAARRYPAHAAAILARPDTSD